MCFEWLYVIFIVMTVLNYIFLDIKVDRMKKEIIEKDKLISAFAALDKAISKLNTGFKDHERRINDIEWERSSLSRDNGEPEAPEPPEKPKYTCKDCKFYKALSGIGFANAVNYFKCEKTDYFFSKENIIPCEYFEKEECLDENVVYANNVKINISSKGARVYTTDGIVTSEELVDRIRKLYLDGGIGFADANMLLERLKQ